MGVKEKEEVQKSFSICPTCLACYNMGYLTFYWYQVNEKTTLEEIEKAMTLEVIHKKAGRMPNLCDGEEVFISDYEYIKVDEYDQPEFIFNLVEKLKDVRDVGELAVFRNNYFYSADLDSNTWESFHSSVVSFDYMQDVDAHLLDVGMDNLGLRNIEIENPSLWNTIEPYIDDKKVIRMMKDSYRVEEYNNKYYVWNGEN
tara:strand:- start:637 stop:1236 length:600 start_codon:yes stop_codon:yes gene_type:complete